MTPHFLLEQLIEMGYGFAGTSFLWAKPKSMFSENANSISEAHAAASAHAQEHHVPQRPAGFVGYEFTGEFRRWTQGEWIAGRVFGAETPIKADYIPFSADIDPLGLNWRRFILRPVAKMDTPDRASVPIPDGWELDGEEWFRLPTQGDFYISWNCQSWGNGDDTDTTIAAGYIPPTIGDRWQGRRPIIRRKAVELLPCPACASGTDELTLSTENNFVVCRDCRTTGPYHDPTGAKWNALPRKPQPVPEADNDNFPAPVAPPAPPKLEPVDVVWYDTTAKEICPPRAAGCLVFNGHKETLRLTISPLTNSVTHVNGVAQPMTADEMLSHGFRALLHDDGWTLCRRKEKHDWKWIDGYYSTELAARQAATAAVKKGKL